VRLTALMLGAALLAGCGTEFVADPPREPPPVVVDEIPTPDPSAIIIPKIGAESNLIPLTIDENNELIPPPVDQPLLAGWYAGRDPAFDGDEYQPGENGPAVIAGHVDGIGPDGRKGFPGIFARLGELVPGDEILIDRKDESRLRFVVSAVASFPKAAFPTEDVYLKTETPTLRLITCGGEFDRQSGHYVSNEIVWADLAS